MIKKLEDIEGLKALTSKLYRKFAFGYAFSSTASWMQRVCFGWLAWELTQSTFWLGMVAFAEFLPVLLVSPLVGDAIDRFDKRRIIMASELLPALALTLLIGLLNLEILTMPLLFFVAFVVGTSMAISHPAQLAWYPMLLRDRTHISSAANIYILSLNIARFAGAGLAGLTISLYGISAAVALTVAGYLIFFFMLKSIPHTDLATHQQSRGSAWKGAVDGLQYVMTHPLLGPMLMLIAITSAGARGIPDLAPALTELQYDMHSEWFSILIAATGLGSVLAGIWNLLSRDHSLETAVRLTVTFSMLIALCAMLLSVIDNFWLSIGLFITLGYAITITAVKSQQVIQSTTDDSMRGRVNAFYFLIFRGGTAFGALWMGVAASSVGLLITLLLGGVACFAASVRYRKLWAKLVELQTPPPSP